MTSRGADARGADARALDERTLRVERTARYYVLGAPSRATTDVWIALHGYAQLAAPFAASAQWPLAPHRTFVFPEALQRFYDSDHRRPGANMAAPVVASWMTREARDDDIADNHAYLDSVWSDVRRAAPEAVLTVFGFSQGGATAARWAAARARDGQPPKRLVLWGSTIAPELALAADAPLRRMTVVLAYGATDRWATPERVAEERARLDAAEFPYVVQRYEGGHRLDDATLALLAL